MRGASHTNHGPRRPAGRGRLAVSGRGVSAALRRLLDSSPIGVLITRGDDHRIVYGNQPAAALFEASNQPLLNLPLAGLPIRRLHRERLKECLAEGRGSLSGLAVRRAVLMRALGVTA